MNTSRSSKRDTVQKESGSTTKSPNKRASQGRRTASPNSPPPYNLRSGRKLNVDKNKVSNTKRQGQSPSRGRNTSKGKKGKSQNRSRSGSQDKSSPSSHLEKHRSSHKKHTITTAEVEQTIKDEINHKFGHTTSPGGLSGRSSQNASPRNTSKGKGKGHRQTKSSNKKSPNSSSTDKNPKEGSKQKQRSATINNSTPSKSSRSTAQKGQESSREATSSKQKGTGKKTPGRKSSVTKVNQSDRIEEETGGKKSIGKRSASRTPGKIEEESNKKGLKNTPGKESMGGRSPGRMLLESGKKTSKNTPSRAKGSKGKSSVGKGSASKSPGQMIEESAKKTTKNTPSKNKTSKRKAAEISKDPDLGAQGDLQPLGGTTTHASMKRVKKNEELLGKEELLEQIKIVDLAKKKPSTSSRRQTRASSGKADKGSAEKNKSAEKERSSSSEKKSKKKVTNSKKKTESEEEAKAETVEMRLLGLRAVVKGKNYCIWRKITTIDDIPMTKVARIIVTAMGWLGCWDWKFKIDDKEVLLPPDDEDDREETTRQKFYGDEVTLTSFGVKEGDKFQFIYHPQSKNPWVHEILVESLDRVQVDTSESGKNSEKAKMFQHAVVVGGSLAVPPDRISPIDYEKVFEDFDKGEREFEKWKRDLGDDFNMNTFNKNKLNETLKIHVYDESKMDPKIKEGDIFFKW